MVAGIEVDDRSVLAALDRLAGAMDDPDPALRQIGAAWLANVQLGFRSGIDPYGVAWEPSARGGQTLVDSGRLRDSFDYDVQGGEMVLGTNVLYALPHQAGATIRARNHPYLTFRVGRQWVRKREVRLPRRRMLPDAGLPEDWRQDALDIIEDYLEGAADG